MTRTNMLKWAFWPLLSTATGVQAQETIHKCCTETCIDKEGQCGEGTWAEFPIAWGCESEAVWELCGWTCSRRNCPPFPEPRDCCKVDCTDNTRLCQIGWLGSVVKQGCKV